MSSCPEDDSGNAFGSNGNEVFRTEWSEERPPSVAVIEAVAAVTGNEPTNLPLLHESVNTDALESIFRPGVEEDVRLSFRYNGFDITVRSDGTVTATLRE